MRRAILGITALLLAVCLYAWGDTIPGTVISSKVTTGNTVNTFPVLDVNEALGGHREVADIAARDAIPAERKRNGMTVWVISEAKLYRLVNDSWVQEAWEPSNANIQAHIGSVNNPHATTAGQVGAEPANSNIQSHIGSTANPHSVTAAQTGAEPANSNIQAHIGSVSNPHSVTAAQVGADPAGTAATTMSSHQSSYDHTQLHGHSNKTTIDKIGEASNLPTWNGSAWPGGSGGGTPAGTSNGEIQYIQDGAFAATAFFKYSSGCLIIR